MVLCVKWVSEFGSCPRSPSPIPPDPSDPCPDPCQVGFRVRELSPIPPSPIPPRSPPPIPPDCTSSVAKRLVVEVLEALEGLGVPSPAPADFVVIEGVRAEALISCMTSKWASRGAIHCARADEPQYLDKLIDT